jgi:ATP-dependent DNA helicase RecQ
LGGKYPRREHSQKIYELTAHSKPDERQFSALTLAEASGLPQRKVKVIIAQLESAGIVERRAGKIRALRAFSSSDEISQFLGEYEQRHTGDRERIESMMRYAETTFCRMRFLREYFGEESGTDCGHCDNCRNRNARPPAPEAGAIVPGPNDGAVAAQLMPDIVSANSTNPFQIGDHVRHRRFGTGQVIELAGENLTVDFGKAGQKRIRREFLRKAS